jgi:LCP family protein required for cell wall assembly
MAKKPKRSQPRQFDVHRSLPKLKEVRGREIVDNTLLDDDLAVRVPQEKPKKKKLTWKKALVVVLLIPAILGLIIGIWDARNFSHASSKMFGSSNLLDLVNSGGLNTDANDRVNVLIVGYSVDDPGHSGASLTDSLLLLSMSTKSHTGYMLSIPRDLYVKIPGYGYHKINEAYNDGGIELLKQIVGDDLQMQVGYSVLVDYSAVREVVNALGGVAVNIQSPDPDGLFDPNISSADGGPLKLSNGVQTLDGQTALNLTRARGEPCGCGQSSYGFPRSDYNRTEHQRQVFAAIKQKLNWKLVLDPRKNGKVFDAFANNLKTDIQLDQVRPLYSMFHKIPDSDLQSVGLDKINNVTLLRGSSAGGLSVLIPNAGTSDYSQIVDALNQLNQQ